MIRQALLAPLAVLAAAGCGAANVYCTAVGCASGVYFNLSDLGPLATGTVTIHACLDAVCVDSQAANPAAAQVVTSDTGSRAAVASITITHGDTILVEGSVPVQLNRLAPNGEQCGPVCFVAGVDVTKDGLTTAVS